MCYFTYATYSGLAEAAGSSNDPCYVQAKRKPLWYVAQEINAYATAHGDELMRRTAQAVFHTGWTADGMETPGPGKVVQQMSDNLLAGVLTEEGENTWVMLVDKTVSKLADANEPRQVQIEFDDSVQSVAVLGATEAQSRYFPGHTATIVLKAGEGRLIELRSVGLTCQEAVQSGLSFATDLNGNCVVDIGDVAFLAQAWLNCIDPQDETCDHPWLEE